VVIPLAERAPLDEDSVYIGDLSGCRLYDRASEAMVGEIVDVDRESSNLPLIVVRQDRGQLLIPFAKAYLPRIDLEARRMEMTLPEGLLDLNAPLTAEDRLQQEAGGAASVPENPRRKSRS
jgi:16S rRNA processing protein RimM